MQSERILKILIFDKDIDNHKVGRFFGTQCSWFVTLKLHVTVLDLEWVIFVFCATSAVFRLFAHCQHI